MTCDCMTETDPLGGPDRVLTHSSRCPEYLSPFDCDTCYDTKLIDSGGREINCPDCVARYHPSSVTVEAIGAGVEFRPGYTTHKPGWIVWDSSHIVGGAYGVYDTLADAERAARVRRGVIKAALTRRANKARKGNVA